MESSVGESPHLFHVFRVGGSRLPRSGAALGEKGDPAPPRAAVAGAGLLDAEQLDLEDEGGRRGNDRRETALAVRVVRGARQLGNLPDGHSRHPLIPSLDDLADADGELEGLAAVLGAVELGAVREGTCVRGGRGIVDGASDSGRTRRGKAGGDAPRRD